ncbi:protein phosphatase CheZ [Steroidobacter sp. S1-65]|uniref:Protein phosphatase CheZ n=1 Tax=Steroidobacter gossypii TaxID=2805490 RepID=A0ABS1X563_9GAMM|nr:protein phosphatase CheZ [Steroidobacter gossypii]MBM0108349.1 protein phosphatase CheZ [Steroidobacter gossypii]
MTSGIDALRAEYGSNIATLAGALAAGDERLFLSELDMLVHRRERTLFTELRKLTGDLQSALDRFSVDSRLVDLAEKEVPDARARLDHVLKMTDEAAHKTMDLVEQCGPLAERTARGANDIVGMWTRFRARQIQVEEFRSMVVKLDAFLDDSRADMDKVRGNLTEVLMAQGYQDLSGQIIRGVMKLVSELETALADLVRLSRTGQQAAPAMKDSMSRGFGPAVPGVDNGPSVSGQSDVDSLLAGLGM